jgi:hypothetical protein
MPHRHHQPPNVQPPFLNAHNVDYRNTRYQNVEGTQINHVNWRPWLDYGRYPLADIRRGLPTAQVPPTGRRRHRNNDASHPFAALPSGFDLRGTHITMVNGQIVDHFQRRNPPADIPHDRPTTPAPPAGHRRNRNNDANHPFSALPRAFDLRGTHIAAVGGQIVDHYHMSQPEIYTGEVITHDHATHANYAATHNPPPYQTDPPRAAPAAPGSVTLGSNATLDIRRDSRPDSPATTDSDSSMYATIKPASVHPPDLMSRPRTPETRPNNPSTFVSRYICFQLDKEATKADLLKRNWQEGNILHAIDNMSNPIYVGYIAKVCAIIVLQFCA